MYRLICKLLTLFLLAALITLVTAQDFERGFLRVPNHNNHKLPVGQDLELEVNESLTECGHSKSSSKWDPQKGSKHHPWLPKWSKDDGWSPKGRKAHRPRLPHKWYSSSSESLSSNKNESKEQDPFQDEPNIRATTSVQ